MTMANITATVELSGGSTDQDGTFPLWLPRADSGMLLRHTVAVLSMGAVAISCPETRGYCSFLIAAAPVAAICGTPVSSVLGEASVFWLGKKRA